MVESDRNGERTPKRFSFKRLARLFHPTAKKEGTDSLSGSRDGTRLSHTLSADRSNARQQSSAPSIPRSDIRTDFDDVRAAIDGIANKYQGTTLTAAVDRIKSQDHAAIDRALADERLIVRKNLDIRSRDRAHGRV
jgi:hypothetical protein